MIIVLTQHKVFLFGQDQKRAHGTSISNKVFSQAKKTLDALNRVPSQSCAHIFRTTRLDLQHMQMTSIIRP